MNACMTIDVPSVPDGINGFTIAGKGRTNIRKEDLTQTQLSSRQQLILLVQREIYCKVNID